ncbi:prenyltransferase/squalene oxidase repeat-containing protein [Streptomyces sp. NPDC060085]|uniref:prenyltransferase/squalene oxidase repeat-containing protein n=1 Tax=Streptomyces sp. NPDC060085 TaxID=3347054 RepID=UPI00365374CE
MINSVEWMVSQATNYIVERQYIDGSWREAPDPRITETALACIALQKAVDPDCRKSVHRAREWIQNAIPQNHDRTAELIEETLKTLALGDRFSIESKLNSSDPILIARTRLLYAAMLSAGYEIPDSILSGLRTDLEVAYKTARKAESKPWSLSELFSVRVIVEYRAGNHDVAEKTMRELANLQGADGSFFGNPISSSIALMAMLMIEPEGRGTRQCASYLLSSQHTDGTWRFIPVDIWDTTLIIRACRGVPIFDSKALGPAVRFLLAQQNPDGGWSCRKDMDSDNDTTAAALLALPDEPDSWPAIDKALAYFSRHQGSDGLWRTWHHTQDPPVPDVVAHVVSALNRFDGRHDMSIDNALLWLADREKGVMNWAADWYYPISYGILEIINALPQCGVKMRDVLLELADGQNADGGWPPRPGQKSRPSATALTLAACAYIPGTLDNAKKVKALRYLRKNMSTDGTWPGYPDMFGPRPLLSHYQNETQAFIVMGLRTVRDSGA